MRKQLKAINGVRKRFSGTVSKFGYKRAYAGPDIKTVCLVDIVDLDTNKEITDHLWMPIRKQLKDEYEDRFL